ncbi:ABC transporter ATP-binding protein [bacterium]|nr:ABC transporter ATP-binding protein [candidate division CSSED10-310 bacterium]
MNLVQVKNVFKTYEQGKVRMPALMGVSLDIERGEFMALAGPSGSGKTTLLNLIGGLDTISEGDVVFDGRSLKAMTQAQLSRLRLEKIGFVFQTFNLIPVLTAQENVEFIMMLQGVGAKERRERARAVLEEVGLEEYFDRRPIEMSGGQQQRVAVARAIVAQPELVLADEPTANLDSKTGRALIELMHEMNRKLSITFVFSTHDRLVMEESERLVKIRDGRLDGE